MNRETREEREKSQDMVEGRYAATGLRFVIKNFRDFSAFRG